MGLGLGFKWILSFCMLIIPIAITLGVLFPLQSHHRSSGGTGSVLGDGGFGGPGPGSGPPKPKNNNVELAQACTQFADLGNPLRFNWAKGQQQYTCTSSYRFCPFLPVSCRKLIMMQSTLTNGVLRATKRAACVWM